MRKLLRIYKRNPVTNLINLFGLAIGLALVIILSAYCYSELTTDNFHKNVDRIYLYQKSEGGAWSPAILKEEIDKKVPLVEQSLRLSETWEPPVYRYGERSPVESNLVFADENFFDFFTYKCLEGDLNTALNKPLTVVITEKLKLKLFGDENAVGKSFYLNKENILTVSAVIEEPIANSCFQFESITSIETRKIVQAQEAEYQNWNFWNFQLFVLLDKKANKDEVCKTITSLFPKQGKDDDKHSNLLNISKLYFSDLDFSFCNYLKLGKKTNVLVLLMVAILVLVISLVNFINISSAHWNERIKIIGIKKIVGASQKQIFMSTIFEAFVVFIASFIISIFLVQAISPILCSYTGISFNRKVIFDLGFILIAFIIITSLSIITSLFPAFKITKSNAVSNIKKGLQANRQNIKSKSLLVGFQFVIAIVLIAFTILVQKQIDFGSNNLGFNKENVVAIKMTKQLSEKMDVLKTYLEENPLAKNISFTQYYPGKVISIWRTKVKEKGKDIEISFNTFSADADFLKILKLKLIKGRSFNKDLNTDNGKVIVNESFLREHRIEDAIGINLGTNFKKEDMIIIGVVEDFHFKPVNHPITPLAIRNDHYGAYCLVQLQSSDFNVLNDYITDIKETIEELSPAFPVHISFFDQAIEQMYKSELQFRRTFFLFSTCAIIICCMGIFAMTLLRIQSRIKEIGIRKVNGAKVKEVMVMLNKDFVKWVVIAFVIATPIAYYAMHKWLENFAYKTELSWWIFVLAGIITISIALMTVSWQTWRAAWRNPVEALRYE